MEDAEFKGAHFLSPKFKLEALFSPLPDKLTWLVPVDVSGHLVSCISIFTPALKLSFKNFYALNISN